MRFDQVALTVFCAAVLLGCGGGGGGSTGSQTTETPYQQLPTISALVEPNFQNETVLASATISLPNGVGEQFISSTSAFLNGASVRGNLPSFPGCTLTIEVISVDNTSSDPYTQFAPRILRVVGLPNDHDLVFTLPSTWSATNSTIVAENDTTSDRYRGLLTKLLENGKLQFLIEKTNVGQTGVPNQAENTSKDFSVATNLNVTFRTGFTAQNDGFQFPNHGSSSYPGGICLGMVSLAQWYFDEKKPVSNSDLTRETFEGTSSHWRDDEFAYRMASSAQELYGDDTLLHDLEADVLGWFQDSHAKVFQTVKNRLLMERKPVYLSIKGPSAAHAVLAIGLSTNGIWIYDPNSPNIEREIEFTNGQLRYGDYTEFIAMRSRSWLPSAAANQLFNAHIVGREDPNALSLKDSKGALTEVEGVLETPEAEVTVNSVENPNLVEIYRFDTDGAKPNFGIKLNSPTLPVPEDGVLTYSLALVRAQRGIPELIYNGFVDYRRFKVRRSSVASLQISPEQASVRTNGTTVLTATAKTADGRVRPVDPNKLIWTATGNVAIVGASSGYSVTVRGGQSVGQGSVKVSLVGSNSISATAIISVTESTQLYRGQLIDRLRSNGQLMGTFPNAEVEITDLGNNQVRYGYRLHSGTGLFYSIGTRSGTTIDVPILDGTTGPPPGESACTVTISGNTIFVTQRRMVTAGGLPDVGEITGQMVLVQ